MNKRRHRADDPERRTWQDPEGILAKIGFMTGMIFADIGCGEGYFALPAARLAGPNGTVFAADIDPDAIAVLRQHAASEGLKNLVALVKPAESTVFCQGCADIVFFGIDLHDFTDPVQVLKNAATMIRPGGLLIDLDWKNEPMNVGPPREKRFSVQKAAQMIESAGFRIYSVQDSGPYHYLIRAGR